MSWLFSREFAELKIKHEKENEKLLEQHIEREAKQLFDKYLRDQKNELETFQNQVIKLKEQKRKLEQDIKKLKESKDLDAVAKENLALKAELATEPRMFCMTASNDNGREYCFHVRAKNIEQVKRHANALSDADGVYPFKFIDIRNVPDDAEPGSIFHGGKIRDCCVDYH